MKPRPRSAAPAIPLALLASAFVGLTSVGESAEFSSDLTFEVQTVPGQNGQPECHTSSLSWSNPGQNSFYVQMSADMEHWTTVHQGWAVSEGVITFPVLTTTPDVVPPPVKPIRTVSLRPSTAGWHAAWMDVVDDAAFPAVQPLATAPDAGCPLIFTAETPTHRFVFTCIPPPSGTPLSPPIWSDIPPLTSLPAPVQATYAAIGVALASPPLGAASGSPLLLPTVAGGARSFYRVEYRLDSDFDGIPDFEELGVPDASGNPHSVPFATDPFDPDTDRDGFPDLIEKTEGTSPISAASQPPTLPEPILEVRNRLAQFHWYPDSDSPASPYVSPSHGVFVTRREPHDWLSFHVTEIPYDTFPDGPVSLLEALRLQEPFEQRLTLRPEQVNRRELDWTYPPLAGVELDSAASGPVGGPRHFHGGGEWDLHRFFESRLWLKTNPPTTVPITRTLHFITTGRYGGYASDQFSGQPMDPVVTTHTFTILPRTATAQNAGVYSEPFDLNATLPTTILPTSESMQDGLVHTTETRLLPVDIEPDANMAGVVGDVVKSAKAGSTVEHFVTPKKSTELNQEYVILKAVGVTADQITDGNANQIVQWDPTVGEAVPGEPLKWRVKRDATNKHEVKIKVKQGGAVAAQMNVWVVWGGPGRFERKPTQPSLSVTSRQNIAGDSSNAVNVEPDRPWLMVFAIEPKSMFDKTAEVPDLMGTVQPSGLTGNHPILNNGQATLDGGANRHWDVSRQFKETITNNGGIAKGLFPDGAGALYANQPKANQADVAVNFPTDPITGNDDTGVIDEINDPYNPTLAGTYQTKQGEVLSHDAPKLFMTIKGLKAGEGVTDYAEFKEFVRLNVGGKWYRASDFLDFNIKLQFTMDADLQNVTPTGTDVSPK